MREPWGETRIDLAAGIVASTMWNVNRGKDVPASRPIDFMPYADRRDKAVEQEQEQDFDLMTFIDQSNGGAV